MAKYSVPGIRFTEIDNTIRSNSLPGLGIGAIVMKSNKGPVNQRILTSSYDNFFLNNKSIFSCFNFKFNNFSGITSFKRND